MRSGASANSRASPSESRSPRLDVTSACSSSSTTRRSEPNRIRRIGRGQDQRKLLGRRQQDVRRIAALALALRGRRVAGAGLDADRQPHLGDRRFEIARDVDRERLQRRDVERVQPALAADVAAGGDELGGCATCVSAIGFERRHGSLPLVGRDREWGGAHIRVSRPAPSPALPHKGEGARPCRAGAVVAQLHQARQKSRQRLARAGRRDQQHRAAGARLRQQFELVRARGPAAAGKPARERLRQQVAMSARSRTVTRQS